MPMAYPVTKSVKRQRSEASRTHGARSQVVLRNRAGYVKQSVLQSVGIRQADLDPFGKRVLDLYARTVSKVHQYDAWIAQYGFLDETGKSPEFIKEYYSAVRTAARLLSQFEKHLERLHKDGPSPLERHLSENYVIDAEIVEEEDGDEE
jgi:hypothetical protein